MTSHQGSTDLSVIFVADGARLEQQSWLLAVSLAMAHPEARRPQVLAYMSPAWMADLSDLTRELYANCGVELRAFPDPPPWRAPYPHGNKLVAASDRRDTSCAVFLDTDMVCLRPLAEMATLGETTVAAAPEGVPTWGRDDDRWDRVYAHFGLPYPTERVRLLRGRRKEFVPYFNAGFVAFPDQPRADDGVRFADRWIETALDIDHNCRVGGKRPWLDQISLPVTLARFGYDTRVLDESWNFSLARRKSMSAAADATMLHYHRYQYLVQAPQFDAILQEFWTRLPRRHHDHARASLLGTGLLGDI